MQLFNAATDFTRRASAPEAQDASALNVFFDPKSVAVIGASSDPSRVFPGTRMAGHMGTDKRTLLNLRVVKVDAEKNLLFVAGPVPGACKGLLTVRPSVKKPTAAKAGA